MGLFPPQLVTSYEVPVVLKGSGAWQRWRHLGSISFDLNFSRSLLLFIELRELPSPETNLLLPNPVSWPRSRLGAKKGFA